MYIAYKFDSNIYGMSFLLLITLSFWRKNYQLLAD